VITSDGSRYIPHHRVVHLDLKGAPPKLSYLKELFPLLRDAGATAILLEYEDMFPFWGPLRNISAKNAYSQRDVQNILKWAGQHDLMVIPLVQTFGHLEFILKLDEFKDMREVPIYPQDVCPSQDRSWMIIQEVIDQVSRHLLKLMVGRNCD
jgi:hexosaminidase